MVFDWTIQPQANLAINPHSFPALKEQVMERIRTKTGHRNRLLRHLEDQVYTVGIKITAAEWKLHVEELPGISVEESIEFDELILRARIQLLIEDPSFSLNYCLYPVAFARFYRKAAFRPFVIEEHERFRARVKSIQPYSQEHLDLYVYSPEDPTRSPGRFFNGLYEAYLGERMYEEALLVARDAHNLRALQHIIRLAEVFMRLNRAKDGIELIERLAPEYRDQRNNFDLRVKELENFVRLGRKPPKPRIRRKDPVPVGELIRAP